MKWVEELGQKFRWSTKKSETFPEMQYSTDDEPEMVFYMVKDVTEQYDEEEEEEVEMTELKLRSAVRMDTIRDYMDEEEYKKFRKEVLNLETEDYEEEEDE